MKENKMVDAINEVSEKYVEEAANYKPKKRSLNPAWMGIAAMAACLVLVLGIGMFRNKDNNKVPGVTEAVAEADSIVCIDINPSIELVVNKHDKVVSAVALNADAQIVLAGMNLKNVELDTALSAIMGSLLKNGYMDEVYNAINVCVENDDQERASQLGEKVTSEISNIFDEEDLIGGINAQICTKDDEVKKLADSYGISVGKLNLAQKVAENMGLSLDVAVTFSISELWDLLEADKVELITKEAALNIAIADAKAELSALTDISEKIQQSNGVFTYIVKFTVSELMAYEYKINAVDGTIISCEVKVIVKEEPTPAPTATPVPTATPTPTVAPTATPTPTPVPEIAKKDALLIAYANAGVSETDAKLTKFSYVSADKEYQIEFSVGSLDYTYVICSLDGRIVRKDVVDNSVINIGTSGRVITVNEALNLALAQAGVELNSLTKCDIKYDVKKDGKAEYKVHFHVDKDHYEYIVNALTGEITEKTKPAGPKAEDPKPTPVPPHEKEDSKVTISFEKDTDTPLTPMATATPTPEPTKKPGPAGPKAEDPKPGPAAKPAGPKEKAEAAKPVGPKESKVTISLEK